MKILKKMEEIKWQTVGHLGLKVSESIVMQSAAGWYVGAICIDPDCDGLIEPYDRFTHYVATPEEAERMLPEPDPELSDDQIDKLAHQAAADAEVGE
tara:strand:- start:1997 stop:2287 length:291 start_codon:yes stop_codon:yes gene_type:complete